MGLGVSVEGASAKEYLFALRGPKYPVDGGIDSKSKIPVCDFKVMSFQLILAPQLPVSTKGRSRSCLDWRMLCCCCCW